MASIINQNRFLSTMIKSAHRARERVRRASQEYPDQLHIHNGTKLELLTTSNETDAKDGRGGGLPPTPSRRLERSLMGIAAIRRASGKTLVAPPPPLADDNSRELAQPGLSPQGSARTRSLRNVPSSLRKASMFGKLSGGARRQFQKSYDQGLKTNAERSVSLLPPPRIGSPRVSFTRQPSEAKSMGLKKATPLDMAAADLKAFFGSDNVPSADEEWDSDEEDDHVITVTDAMLDDPEVTSPRHKPFRVSSENETLDATGSSLPTDAAGDPPSPMVGARGREASQSELEQRSEQGTTQGQSAEVGEAIDVLVVGDWEMHHDPKTNLDYFVNTVSQVTTWQMPAKVEAALEALESESQADDCRHSTADLGQQATESSSGIDDWTIHVDDQSGLEYFVNRHTGETSWELPDAVLKSLQESAAGCFETSSARKSDEGAVEAKHSEEDTTSDAWLVFTDDASGRQYFVHAASGVTKWRVPKGARVIGGAEPNKVPAERAGGMHTPHEQHLNDSDARVSGATVAPGKDLPDDLQAHQAWVRLNAPANKKGRKVYFCNMRTRKTKWTLGPGDVCTLQQT
eukprot:INCI16316.6.p1 GENE.INCI16316.6~~INCI16316.6.p1  ORF type:complete len:601 (-),score=84.20 INCI16316.6:1252-2970(-)